MHFDLHFPPISIHSEVLSIIETGNVYVPHTVITD